MSNIKTVGRLGLRVLDSMVSITGYRFEGAVNPLSSPFTKHPKIYSLVPASMSNHWADEQKQDAPLDPEIVEDILNFFDIFPPFYTEDIEPALRIGGAWREFLEKTRPNQLKCIRERDGAKLTSLMERMFYNELISGLWNHGTFHSMKRLPMDFIAECDVFERISDQPSSRLATNQRFDLWGLKTDAGIVKHTDPQHGIQATHILRCLDFLGKSEKATVLDLGSGFGGLAEKLQAWSPKPIRCILVDIPLNLTLAYAYLARTHGRNAVRLATRPEHVEDKDAKFILIPTALVPQVHTKLNHNILHNGKSFSEMDLPTVKRYLELLANENVNGIIETNANRIGSKNWGDHNEVISRQLPIPPTHQLLSRFTDSRPGRYVTSIYLRK